MIHVSRNNHREGPYLEEDVRRKISSGELALTDLGWREGLANWTTLEKLLYPEGPAPSPGIFSPSALPERATATSTQSTTPVSGRAGLVVPAVGLLGAFFDIYTGRAFLTWIEGLHSEVSSQHPVVQFVLTLLYKRYGENAIEIVHTAAFLLIIFGLLGGLSAGLFFFRRYTKVLAVVLMICGIAPMFHHKFEFFGLPMTLAGLLAFGVYKRRGVALPKS